MKDKESRRRLDNLESNSLTVKACPKCKHLTIQQCGGIATTVNGHSYFKLEPEGGATLNYRVGDYSWVLGYRCLVCGLEYNYKPQLKK